MYIYIYGCMCVCTSMVFQPWCVLFFCFLSLIRKLACMTKERNISYTPPYKRFFHFKANRLTLFTISLI